MKEKETVELITKMELGLLSRNRHFDAYRDPLVQSASRDYKRLSQLLSLFERVEDQDLDVSLRPYGRHRDLWQLVCRGKRLHYVWTAFLKQHELELLLHKAPSRSVLKPLVDAFERFEQQPI